jgi:hypothetical protein
MARISSCQNRARCFALGQAKVKKVRDTVGMALVGVGQDAPGAGQFGSRAMQALQIYLGIAPRKWCAPRLSVKAGAGVGE